MDTQQTVAAKLGTGAWLVLRARIGHPRGDGVEWQGTGGVDTVHVSKPAQLTARGAKFMHEIRKNPDPEAEGTPGSTADSDKSAGQMSLRAGKDTGLDTWGTAWTEAGSRGGRSPARAQGEGSLHRTWPQPCCPRRG